MNVARWLERAGLNQADRPAIAVGGVVVYSYAELARRASGLATGLRQRCGLASGERVALLARNHASYLEALFGIWWAGLVAVPINAKLHPLEISWIVEHCGARVIFTSEDVEGAGGVNGVKTLAFATAGYEDLTRAEPTTLIERGSDELAWLFYTSGTTGRPKGAMLTHGNLCAMSLAYLAAVDPTDPRDAIVHAAPMSHGSGLYAIPHVCRAALNVIPESGHFEADEVIDLVSKRTRTSMFAPPTMISRLVDSTIDCDPSSLRTLIWGGAPMHVPAILRALDRFGCRLAQIYGQGESPMTISVLTKSDIGERSHPKWLHRLSSAGTPNPAVEVQIAGENGQVSAPGEVGEILVRGMTVMSGYWNDAEATALALQGGWLHTGDIGTFDEDGYLTLMDRSKDIVISGGSNIYPREVEEVIAIHQKVQEVAVLGRPDPEWGEIVVAYVVGDVDAGDLDRICLEHLARFKRPRDYVFLSSLPKNNYGKIAKNELRTLDRVRWAESQIWHQSKEETQ